jgi:hypothetical protein
MERRVIWIVAVLLVEGIEEAGIKLLQQVAVLFFFSFFVEFRLLEATRDGSAPWVVSSSADASCRQGTIEISVFLSRKKKI